MQYTDNSNTTQNSNKTVTIVIEFIHFTIFPIFKILKIITILIAITIPRLEIFYTSFANMLILPIKPYEFRKTGIRK